MGGVAAAVAEGSEAVFLNPAGLARMGPESPSEVSLAYSALLETAYAGSAAYARPMGPSGVLGAGLVYFSQSSLTSYSVIGDPTGQFTPNDLALSVAYARGLGKLLLGGNLKLIRSSIAEASGVTAAADLGIEALHVAEAGGGALDFGGALLNLGPPIKVGSVSSPLPLNMRGGLVWHTSPVLNSALDLNLPVDQDPYVSLGLEAVLDQRSWKGFLRFGYDQSRARDLEGLSGVTAGAGLDLESMRIDYAWVPFGDLGITNRISVAFRF